MTHSKLNAAGIVAAGTLLIVLTLAVFFFMTAGWKGNAANFIAFGFLLLSEIALLCGSFRAVCFKAGSSPAMLLSGMTGALVFYFIATLIAACIKFAFNSSPGSYLLLQLFLLTPTAISVVLFTVFAKRAEHECECTGTPNKFMPDIEDRLAALQNKERDPELIEIIHDVYQTARYADRTGTSKHDAEIAEAVRKMEQAAQLTDDTKPTVMQKYAVQIKFLIRQRAKDLG